MFSKTGEANPTSRIADLRIESTELKQHYLEVRSTRSRYFLTIVLIAFLAFTLFGAAFIAAGAFRVQDLAQYWAAAHLVAKNPYSSQFVLEFEKSHGIALIAPPLVIKNPPWAIMLVLPLGLLNYQASFAAWSVMSIIVVAGCARAAWFLANSDPSLAPALLSLLFGPTIVLLILGQFTVLVLLGVTLFLILTQQKRDWLAGTSLLLVLGKPHVSFVFLVAVFLWVLKSKRWSILLSGTVSLAAASLAAVAMNPHIFGQFLQRTELVVNETESYPNLGGMLYSVSGIHVLALLPQCVGIIWLLVYWKRHQADWDWKTNGMVVLIVSVTCSYYSYPYDEILMLPPLITAFAIGNRRIFLAGFLATNLGYALYISNLAGHYGFGYMFLWWTASAWLITYLLAINVRPLPNRVLDQS